MGWGMGLPVGPHRDLPFEITRGKLPCEDASIDIGQCDDALRRWQADLGDIELFGIDGKRTEGYWRSHQVPMGEMHENPSHVRLLETWMKGYRPEELFDEKGRLRSELAALPPRGRHSRQACCGFLSLSSRS